jgi:hypothetical protein
MDYGLVLSNRGALEAGQNRRQDAGATDSRRGDCADMVGEGRPYKKRQRWRRKVAATNPARKNDGAVRARTMKALGFLLLLLLFFGFFDGFAEVVDYGDFGGF